MTPPGDAPLLVADFDGEAALAAAVQAMREAGCRSLEACGPLPSDAVSRALGESGNRVAPAALAAGLAGAAAAFSLQYVSAVWDYPFIVGGKPYGAWPPLMPASFEAGILSAVTAAVLTMLVLCRLPRLHHPLFDVAAVAGASRDRWVLAVAVDRPGLDAAELRGRLEALGPHSVTEVDP